MRRRRACLALVFVTGCAYGVVSRPDGTTLHGWALGQAKLECCDTTFTTKSCDRIEGGSVSGTMATIFGAIMTGLVAILPLAI